MLLLHTAQQECRKTVQVNAQHHSSTKMQICATVESQDFELKVTYDARITATIFTIQTETS